jgi:hypothetical protein
MLTILVVSRTEARNMRHLVVVTLCSVSVGCGVPPAGGLDDGEADAEVDLAPDGPNPDADVGETEQADGETTDELADEADQGDIGAEVPECGTIPPPDFLCSGEYVARGSPLEVSGWPPMSGYGGVRRLADGWGWVGIVRESGGGPRIVGYRFIRADEHFTALDTSAAAENLPLVADGVEWGLGFASHLECGDRWLLLLQNTDRRGEVYMALYASDGRAVGAPVHLSSVFPGGTIDVDETAESFLFFDAQAYGCARVMAPVRVSASDLLVTRGTGVSLDDYQTVAAFWRSDGHWILRGQDACSSDEPRLVLWDVLPDGTASASRPVTGLPELTGVWSDWSAGFPPSGIGCASAITMVGGVVEMLYAPIDPDTAAALLPATTIVHLADAGEEFGLALAPEGEWGWGMLYKETSGSDGMQRVLFARFTRGGDVVQRTLLVEEPALGTTGGFLLRWLGDRYIVAYRDGADLIDEFICSAP